MSPSFASREAGSSIPMPSENSVRELSSRLTRLYKYFFSGLAIVGSLVAVLFVLLTPESRDGGWYGGSRWNRLVPVGIGLLFFYWSCMRLKQVRLAGDVLLISNFRTEIEVPLRDVERVSGSLFMDPEVIWLHFRRPTEFGSRVVFMAPWRLLGSFSFHPLVRELRELVSAASSSGAR